MKLVAYKKKEQPDADQQKRHQQADVIQQTSKPPAVAQQNRQQPVVAPWNRQQPVSHPTIMGQNTQQANPIMLSVGSLSDISPAQDHYIHQHTVIQIKPSGKTKIIIDTVQETINRLDSLDGRPSTGTSQSFGTYMLTDVQETEI